MKNNIIFVLFSFLIAYLNLGFFLNPSSILFIPSIYFIKLLKILIGDLSYAMFILYIPLQLSFSIGIKRAFLIFLNFLLLILIYLFISNNTKNLGIFSVFSDFSFLISVLFILILVYLNYNYCFNLLKAIKLPNFKIKSYSNSTIVETQDNTIVLKDDGDIRFIKQKELVKSDIDILIEQNNYQEDLISFKTTEVQETEQIKTIAKEELPQVQDEVIFTKPKSKEQNKENKENKTINKVEILNELAENKAILSELELGVSEKPKDFTLPNISLLTPAKNSDVVINEDELDLKINELLAKLKHFKIDGDIVKTYWGPVVTTFEFKPAADVKLSKISSLADDLAMALKATSIRILAPIPGKDVVGIEIPNKQAQTIYIRSIFENDLFINSKSKLTLALGKDIVGNTFITDLKRLPHLLIAGTTGSGKSVGINAMILSLLFKNTPRTLRLLMIDPKMLEFSMYNDIPHLLVPVITKAEKATIALKNMVNEMERRYELMALSHTKDIETYNEKAKKEGREEFAYIVIIIDELADLMMTSGKEIEIYISRLAQMARACGMHLIVATQRPSVDVITGLIKANLPSRLSYKVSTQTDSKVILDTKGAESLLGRGDCLFTPPGTSSIVRLHAPFASEEDILKVVEYLKQQEEVVYQNDILSDSLISVNLSNKSNEAKDELFEEAIRVMREDNKTSISYLQRRLSIGYNRAANIIEQCELEGILSAPNAKGVRSFLE